MQLLDALVHFRPIVTLLGMPVSMVAMLVIVVSVIAMLVIVVSVITMLVVTMLVVTLSLLGLVGHVSKLPIELVGSGPKLGSLLASTFAFRHRSLLNDVSQTLLGLLDPMGQIVV